MKEALAQFFDKHQQASVAAAECECKWSLWKKWNKTISFGTKGETSAEITSSIDLLRDVSCVQPAAPR
eukprot:2458957-Prymnesium_polylepis.1